MTSQNTDKQDLSITFGKILANPPPGDEVVISGISGQYPHSESVLAFRDNLFHKVDMVSGDTQRWDPGHPEIPQRTGKVPHISKFDTGFFGFHYRQAEMCDPSLRRLLENAVAAIFDAGIHPDDLMGTNTGVFVGACFSETEKTWFVENLEQKSFAIYGCARSMLANRISYYLKLKGPSFTCDTACSSSLYAFEHAYKAIRDGLCETAIVAGANLCLHPFLSLQFARLGVLSGDGRCKVFDKNGNGYARSEAIAITILQKASKAKRVYATVIHAKTNCDGYKNSGITYPSGEMQIRLLKEFYEECQDRIKPTDLTFLEAHGTGTKVGDPEELQAIEEIFVTGRKTPLFVGSVKSNIGHSEPSSGLCSVTKAVLAAETGYIPPNLHYSEPRPESKALLDGRIKVVTEKTPFADNRGLIGINSFGFGGGNCHIALKWNTKTKSNGGHPKDNIPRLVCISGRTEEAVSTLLDDVIENGVDVEHIRLLQETFGRKIAGYLYRGYSLISRQGEISRSISEKKFNRSLFVCFGDLQSSFKDFKDFLDNPVIANTIRDLQNALEARAKVLDILSKPVTLLEQILATFFNGIIVAELLKALKITPTKVFGFNQGISLGVIITSYYDQALTLQEAVDCAIAIAQAAQAASGIQGNHDISTLLAQNDPVATQLQHVLTRILGKPRRLSKRVIFDGSPLELSSTYLLNNFGVNTVLEGVRANVHKRDIILEFGCINDVLRKVLNHCYFLNGGRNYVEFLLTIGRLFELGFNPEVQEIYPHVEFPVSRGTPMISPKIKWKHGHDWYVSLYRNQQQQKIECATFNVASNDQGWSYITEHLIDGKCLFPATGYLQIVWETFSYMLGFMISNTEVVFENCKFKRACPIVENVKLVLTVNINRSGEFEVVESNVAVVTGRIKYVLKDELTDIPLPTDISKSKETSMTSKDIYKELRIRGYNYKGKFRGIQECDASVQMGKIKWDANWITFIDNMLQLKIIQEDTRLLYVPTGIHRLYINAKKHTEYVTSFNDEKPILPVYLSKATGIIRSGGIEIRGLNASSIPRRKYLATPVLEKAVFVPNVGKLKSAKAIRINMQIILENLFSIKVKVVELIDDTCDEDKLPLGEEIHDALTDLPLIQPEIIILSKKPYELKNIKVEDRKLLTEVECSLVVASKIFQRPNIMHLAFGSIKENGFVLSRESLEFDVSVLKQYTNISVVTMFQTDNEYLVLFRKKTEFVKPTVVSYCSLILSCYATKHSIKVKVFEDPEFSWLSTLQEAMEQTDNVLVVSQNEPLSGVLGLVACIKREPEGHNIKVVFLPETKEEFDLNDEFYQEQLSKNLVVNIYKDNQWGTYRHLLFEQDEKQEVVHCYLNTLVRGDLSSLKWLQGPLNPELTDPDHTLVNVYYASLNFRDIMTASGKINVDAITRDRREQEGVQGFEFSGRTSTGRRVFGMVTNNACASLVNASSYLLWDVPDSMSLEEAATIPVVYLTSYYALFRRGNMKRGDSVLIHSGTGGVGQAAINLALYVGCTVYTTCGTPEKREFLKKTFPQLTDKNIASSRSINFEKHIFEQTKGRGVDIVLNSLAEEKLMASVRCIAKGGRFIEIGKFDLANNNELNLLLLSKEASFHGVMMDLIYLQSPKIICEIANYILEGLKNGGIRPLNRTVFKMDQAEEAFRYMGSGQHMGKVMIQVRKEEKDRNAKPRNILFPATPRYLCDKEKSYIICGGLGGFGLELADWLALRGCKYLVLNSRYGIKTGYQTYRINIWRSYGCIVNVSTDDITTYEGCENLIKVANEMGPVGAIFNLAVVLKDAILQNQTVEAFKMSFAPKANATQHLDKVSRLMCPELRDFVVFSSVSCGRGNAGQTNYGMANSVMERICEQRQRDGLPAIAIEWGAVGDVGLVAELQNDSIELAIGGTLQQRISNCLQVMDNLLKQNESAIVSSIVVAEKRAGAGGADNIVDAVANILGVKDLKAISLQATLAEVGMDSMTAVEIKQTLEIEYGVFLSALDIKNMTFAKLIEIQTDRELEVLTKKKKEKSLMGMDMFVRFMIDEATGNQRVIPLNTTKWDEHQNEQGILILPGVEGFIAPLECLYKKMNGNLIGLQYTTIDPKESLEEMAQEFFHVAEETFSKTKPFTIIAYSFGGCIAMELVAWLEQQGYLGTLILIDASPEYMWNLLKILEVESEEKFQISMLVHLLSILVPFEIIAQHVEKLMKLNTIYERLEYSEIIVGSDHEIPHSVNYVKSFTLSIYNRLKGIMNWKPEYQLKSKVVLLKPTMVSTELSDADYGLSKYCEQPVDVKVFEGNHISILDNKEVADTINRYLNVNEQPETENKGDLVINVEKMQTDVSTRL
ncbi:hypothetical protein ABEB36_006624 [Hypothenemus hampei]|uniref:Uncharacterized protein n=1 Tax=Hypothenemus hampei TaxID=57062 RepID=A0ABD1EU70_HYPHA